MNVELLELISQRFDTLDDSERTCRGYLRMCEIARAF